jgi:hypothetical protein
LEGGSASPSNIGDSAGDRAQLGIGQARRAVLRSKEPISHWAPEAFPEKIDRKERRERSDQSE